jgi:hypothetical protein
MRPEAIAFVGGYAALICWAIYMVSTALRTPSSSGKGFMEGERRAGPTAKLPGS